MKRLAIFLIVPALLFGQGSQLPKYHVANLPATTVMPTGTVQVIDGNSAADCTIGGGHFNVICIVQGGVWTTIAQQGTASNPAGPAFAVNFANSGVTSFQGDSTITVNPSTHTLQAPVTSSVVRDKGGIVYDAKAFGAVANGVVGNPSAGTDDGPAVRTALSSLVSAGGGILHFAPGVYRLTSHDTTTYGSNSVMFAPASHVHIECDKGAILYSPNYHLFFVGYQNGGTFNGGLNNITGYTMNPIQTPGVGTVTTTLASDASHFAAGDFVYLMGGPGTEANGDSEINQVVSADPATGNIVLAKPTVKPYNTNGSGSYYTPGNPNNIRITNAQNFLYTDESVVGCEAYVGTGGDFYVQGQVVGVKLLNNTVHQLPGSTRGIFNNYQAPAADVEMAGNTYYGDPTSVNGYISQPDFGMRDMRIHDNTFSTYQPFLNPSEGVANIFVTNNHIYEHFLPGALSSGWSGLYTSTVYNMAFSNNTMVLRNDSSNAVSGVSLGLSNGSCSRCVVSNNMILLTGNIAFGIYDDGSDSTITGNNLTTSGYGITLLDRTGGVILYSATSAVNSNIIHMTDATGQFNGISLSGTRQVIMVGNNISSDVLYTGGSDFSAIHFSGTGSAGAVVVGNQFTNFKNGIIIQSGDNPATTGNVCVGVTNASTTLCSPTLTNAQFKGSITTDSSNTYTAVRTLPTVVSDEVDIGSFVTTSNAALLVVELLDNIGRANHYVIGMSFDSTHNVWKKVIPISSACSPGTNCATNNSDLEFNCSARVYSLRIRRTLGALAGTAVVNITQYGLNTDVFTPSTATSSVAAPTLNYPYTLYPASATDIGGVICDGTTITCAADGTITATAAGASRFSVSITPAAATISSCVEQTFNTFTGIATGKAVTISPPSALNSHVWIGSARASASNTIAINFCADATGGTPASGTWTATQ